MSTEPGSMAYMQNRELSWLKFNERVLREANRTETPLLDRLKFVSIFSGNLDEFFMVRVGALTHYSLYNKEYQDNKTGMTAQEQLDEIYRAAVPLYELREKAFSAIVDGLKHHNVHLLRVKDLDESEIKNLRRYFLTSVLPILSPFIIDSIHPIPRFVNKQLNIVLALESKKGYLYGIIAVPSELDLVVPVSGEGYRFVSMGDLVCYFASLAFPNYKILAANILAVTRSANIDTDDGLIDGIDYRQHMKNLLKKRQHLFLVRLEMAFPVSNQAHVDYICDKLDLDVSKMLYSSFPLDFSFGFTLEHYLDNETVKRLSRPAHRPAETIPNEKKNDMIKTLGHGDILLSYPFESISPFLALLHQAADDPSTVSIKMTLYRLDILSQVVDALIRAVENGKEVVVLMELRARFDEENNIVWAHRLEEAGCHVIYGLIGYKVHSKVCLITRRVSGKIQYLTQIGTGNYNEKTARQYTDLSLITANQEIGSDAASFFANLLLGNLEGSYKQLWVAPNSLKTRMIQYIEEEAEKARKGLGGSIIIKCNSLTDKEIIEKLVEASQCGVKISLLVRGICCLVPQIPGLTENIRVVSIVGRFLEHSRLFCFGNGSDKKMFLASSDLMTRNTERRVEVACPVLESALKDRLYRMLETMLRDNTQAWELTADGSYVQRYCPNNDLVISSQELFTQEAHTSQLSLASRTSRHAQESLSLWNRIRQAIRLIVQRCFSSW